MAQEYTTYKEVVETPEFATTFSNISQIVGAQLEKGVSSTVLQMAILDVVSSSIASVAAQLGDDETAHEYLVQTVSLLADLAHYKLHEIMEAGGIHALKSKLQEAGEPLAFTFKTPGVTDDGETLH